MIYNTKECTTNCSPVLMAWNKTWWCIGFAIYFSIMASYFYSLWIGMKLGLKPEINIEEEPGPLVKRWVAFWNWLPAKMKVWLSHQNKYMYELPITKSFIKPYQYWNYKNIDEYMKRFRPYFGGDEYKSFQDFFARELIELPNIKSKAIMPCEGLLCDVHDFSKARDANIKGDLISLRNIFGKSGADIPKEYQFLNVFLSNRDYHHIHSPINGVIKKIEHIPGDLIVLRPWFYHHNPSVPALVNERVNIDIEDDLGNIWFLSIVGGPVVNSILVNEKTRLGESVEIGQKIAGFELGSTCCMAFPKQLKAKKGDHVKVFEDL